MSAGPAGAVGPVDKLWGRLSCVRPGESVAEPVTELQLNSTEADAGAIRKTGAASDAANPAMTIRRLNRAPVYRSRPVAVRSLRPRYRGIHQDA